MFHRTIICLLLFVIESLYQGEFYHENGFMEMALILNNKAVSAKDDGATDEYGSYRIITGKKDY